MKNLIAAFLILGMFAAISAEKKEKGDGPRGGSPIEMMDKDSDGTLTRSEWDTFQDKSFKAMDTNSDGKITETEAKNARPEKK